MKLHQNSDPQSVLYNIKWEVRSSNVHSVHRHNSSPKNNNKTTVLQEELLVVACTKYSNCSSFFRVKLKAAMKWWPCGCGDMLCPSLGTGNRILHLADIFIFGRCDYSGVVCMWTTVMCVHVQRWLAWCYCSFYGATAVFILSLSLSLSLTHTHTHTHTYQTYLEDSLMAKWSKHTLNWTDQKDVE